MKIEVNPSVRPLSAVRIINILQFARCGSAYSLECI